MHSSTTSRLLSDRVFPARLWRGPVAAALFSICGGLAAGACTSGAAAVPPGASAVWSEMGGDARRQHMIEVVQPQMADLFQEFDSLHKGDRFADFDCGTCHGSGAVDGKFAMPNPELPHIDASGLYKKHRKATPEMAHFMWKKVEPRMAELLGVSHGSKGEINCGSCHVLEQG